MYHYVRDAASSAFPRLNVRTPADLEGQLDYIIRHYTVVGCSAVRDAYLEGRPLPPRPCLLSFDDGFVEHLDVVAPALARRRLTACFAPPARPVLERRVLDVQKSQFVLAASGDHAALARLVLDMLEDVRVEYDLPATDDLRARYARPGRYDGLETMLVKRLLQDGLPEAPRRALLDRLFAELVTHDEHAFADDLYLSVDGVRRLLDLGMDIAGHGLDHVRLGEADADTQERELDGTRALLGQAGVAAEGWTMVYPYGSRDASAVRLLAERGCSLGLTTDVGLAGLDAPPLELPRLNTNDLPVADAAEPVEWTRRATA
jgi:peptidoglycan/xylan/chitin deacetylase (PgdA/CDA1 family)